MAGELEQRTQINFSRLYDDVRTPGATMESAPVNLEENLNDLRTMARLISGEPDWFLAPSTTIAALAAKILAYKRAQVPGTADFVLGGSASGSLLTPAMFGGGGTIAVGPASVDDGGVIAADEAAFAVAGTLGIGLSTAFANNILLNCVTILDADTNAAPVVAGSGETIFGLLQVVTGSADGVAIAANPSENLQASFAYYDKATDVLTTVALPAGTYHFATACQNELANLPRGALLNAAGAGGFIGSSGGGAQLPLREFEITGPGPGNQGPGANDPMNVATGVFVTGGAQATNRTLGTPGLPGTGAAFASDSRIEVYRNGQRMMKRAGAATDVNECGWVSATQLDFGTSLFIGEQILIISPSTF